MQACISKIQRPLTLKLITPVRRRQPDEDDTDFKTNKDVLRKNQMHINKIKIGGRDIMKQITYFMMILLTVSSGVIPPLYGQPNLWFNSGTRIQANGINMRVDTYASVPCVVDWDEDGKKDLLVGCFFNGNVHLFLNSGSNGNPVFTLGTMLQANGTVISVAYG
jgi:hypothetical protein